VRVDIIPIYGPNMLHSQTAERILVVDDDPAILTLLKDILESEQYNVSIARNGNEMRRCMTDKTFDLVTLDVGLPGSSGLEMALEVRRQSNVPIIVISGRNTDVDKVVGLEVGADDYITKPFNIRELIARVRAVLRRTTTHSEPRRDGNSYVKSFHDYAFNTQTRKLTAPSGATTVLTSAEADLLVYLLENVGVSCSRDDITAAMKGHDWSPFDRSLDTLVARLRRKIEPDAENPSIILTVRGVGYRLSAT